MSTETKEEAFSTSQDGEDIEGVRDFIRRMDIAELVKQARQIAAEVFPKVISIHLEISHDPEEDAEWVAVRVKADACVADLLAAYRQYTERWVRESPPAKRYLVCLTFGPA
jgi:hypothetical protein